MAPIEPIRTLRQRKQALLIESDLNRLVLRMEIECLRNSTSRYDAALARGRSIGAWLLPVVSVLGIFSRRRPPNGPSQTSWYIRALRLLTLIVRLGRKNVGAE